jgi:ATP-dependent exoDNAse (exonuclease V) beta subunit
VSSPHLVTLASAGTGKTYRLSGRFLDLLLAGVAPERVLATTFTRKAAGEILERVLVRLMKAVESERERDALGAERLFGGAFDQAQALGLLERLARGLQRFEVRTLDSFFVTLGRLFAADLGLAPGWTIADAHAAAGLREEALTRLLQTADEEDFAALLRELHADGGARRSVRKAVRDVIDHGRALLLESAPEAWRRVEAPPAPEDGALEDALAVLERCPLPQTKGGKVNANWKKGHDKLLAQARAGAWKEAIDSGPVCRRLAGEETYYGKPIPAAYAGGLDALAEIAGHELLTRLDHRNRRTRELLERYEQALAEVKRERGRYAFEDLPRALAPSQTGAPGPIEVRDLDLALRLDTRTDHLLLDEFQDTAPAQWRVLGPMAEELAADGTGERSLFCVGDVKQSIYGWRGAEPRLLETLAGHLHAESATLERNHRSSAVVLDSVGRVFGSIASNAALEGDDREPLREGAGRFAEGFDPPEAARDLPGVVELREAPPPASGEAEKAGAADRRLDHIAIGRVARMAAEEPEATIAVLVRRNERIAPLIDGLQRAGIAASGEGGNPLTDSAAVLHLVSLLHLADHPSDRLAAFHLAGSPFGTLFGEAELPAAGARLASAVRRRLADEGYGPFCAGLSAAVEDHPAYGEWDRRRFRQLVELAFASQDRFGLRADRFVDLVREQRVEDPSSARIKVMTVHAAKGLEFDAVVLCELDGELTSRRGSMLVERPDPRGSLTFVSADPGKAVCRLSPELAARRQARLAREAQESLALLYVAMTRARHRLELLVRHRPADKDPAATPAGILRSALGGGAADEDGVLWRHEASVEAWRSPPEEDETTSPVVLAPAPPFALAPSKGARRLPRRSPSAEEGGPLRRGSELLASASSAALRTGSLVHRWCEEIEWLETFERSADELLDLAREIEPDEGARRAALEVFEQALAAPAIRAALGRPAGEVEVWRERAFRVALGEGADAALWSGTFDRVVLHGPSGAWERAEVFDFKTDRVEGAALVERAERYRPQLEAYRGALAHLCDLAPSRIALTLLFLHSGERFDL